MSARVSTKALIVSRWCGDVDKDIVFASIKNRLRKQSREIKKAHVGYKVRFSKQANFDLAPDGRITATWPFAVE